MATGDILESLLGQPSNGHTGRFYKPIDRTDDLIHSTNLRGGQGIRPPELYIAPSTSTLGALPTQLITALDGLLVFKTPPPAEEVVRGEIGELVARFGGADPRGNSVLLRVLQQKKLTGEITLAARRLNEARLSPAERGLLSRSNIALYAFYRAAIGMQVSDVDGITSNALSSLDKVKSYLNRKLVSEVLDRENLARTGAELSELQKRIAERNLSYREGEAERLIVAEYRQVKGRASVIAACDEFLSRGIVRVPPGVDRDQLVKRMIGYLEQQGFNAAALPGLTASFKARATGLRVQFEDASTDDGRLVDWRWRFGDGGSSNVQNPAHEYLVPGVYVVELTITDNDGNKMSVSDNVTVQNATQSLKLKVRYQATPVSGDPEVVSHVEFHIEGAAARITKARWEFGDDGDVEELTGSTAAHEYAEPGDYTVTVVAFDDAAQTATTTQLVEIRASTMGQERYSIVGRVVEDDSGKPAPEILVRAFDEDAYCTRALGRPAETSADGTFEIRYGDLDFKPEPSRPSGANVMIRVYAKDDRPLLLKKGFKHAGPRLDVGTLRLDDATCAPDSTTVQESGRW